MRGLRRVRRMVAALCGAAVLLCACTGPAAQGGSLSGATSATRAIAAQLQEYDTRAYIYRNAQDSFNLCGETQCFGGVDIPPDMLAHVPDVYLSGSTALAYTADLGQAPESGALLLGQPVELAGMARLVFYARGAAGGEVVRFFVGGSDATSAPVSAIITLSSVWQAYELDLAGVDGSVDVLFGWEVCAAENPEAQSVSFRVDQAYYERGEPLVAPMLLESYMPVAVGEPGADNNGWAMTADNAAACVAMYNGEEPVRGRQIADALLLAEGGTGKLRDAYPSGPFPADGAASVTDAFAAAEACSAGTLAWGIMALCSAAQHERDGAAYLEAAVRLGDAALTLRDDATGGFAAGFDADGNARTQLPTQGNAELMSAFGLLAFLCEAPQAARFREARDDAMRFVLSMFDDARGCFLSGTAAGQTPDPTAPVLLEANALAALALPDEYTRLERRALDYVERYMRVIGGYTTTDQQPLGMGFAGMAQLALAYGQAGGEERGAEIMSALEAQMIYGWLYAASTEGLATGQTDAQGEPIALHRQFSLHATAWAAMAQQGYNPLSWM